MFFTETHGRGLGLVAHAPSDFSGVRILLKESLQRTIHATFFVGLLTKKLF